MTLFDFQRQFPDEPACLAYLERQRWGIDSKNRTCPHCGSLKSYAFTTRRLYKCADCRKQFTVTVGTIFEGSHIPLQKWFYAVYLVISLKKGISSVQLAKYLGITQKSAWFMLQRIRYGFERSGDTQLRHIVEIDETYVGGVKHGNGSGPADKAVIFGALERGGAASLQHVRTSGSRVLLPVIGQHIAPGTTVYSDQWGAYSSLKRRGYIHESVNHAAEEYVRGAAHTNTIEGLWAHLKLSLAAVYVGVSSKHLQAYCAEFAFRYNRRTLDDGERFVEWFDCTRGHLTYKALIADSGSMIPNING